jgi:hypothetical protein
VSSSQITKRGLRIGAVAVLAGAALTPFAAAQSERLTVEVGQCVDLPTPEQRLACFEAQVEAARAPAAPPPTSAAPPATSRVPAPAARAEPAPSPPPAASSTANAPAEFGFRERRAEPEAAAAPEVRAKIAELRETVPNAFLITLDNGQVWRQTRPDPYVSMKVGHDVLISFSRFRAYRLTSPDMRGFVQVERVR